MLKKHCTRTLARFVSEFRYEDLSNAHTERLKQSMLEALGAAIAAFDEPVLRSLRVHVKDFNSSGPCTLIGGVKCAPDMAAYHNSGLVGFLELNDVYLGANGTIYPSDAMPAIIAAAEYRGGDGKKMLAALAVSYLLQIGLNKAMSYSDSEEFAFTQTSLGTTAGVASILDIDVDRLVNGLNIAASSGACPHPVAMGNLSDWMHMVRPGAVRHGVEAAFFGLRGIGGVAHELDGEDRVPDLLCREFSSLDLKNIDLDALLEISSRKYMANAHAQSAVEAAVHMRHLHDFSPEQIASVKLETFKVAYEHLGGGNGVDCVDIVSREEAVNSLPFLISTALLNGSLQEGHFTHRSIRSQEMQKLRANVEVVHNPELDSCYPEEMCHKLHVTLEDGTTHTIKKCNYLGHYKKPMDWDKTVNRFHEHASEFANDQLRNEMVDVVQNLEKHSIDKLTSLLSKVAPV